MKKLFIIALLAIDTLYGHGQENNFTVSGNATTWFKTVEDYGDSIRSISLIDVSNGKQISSTEYKGPQIVLSGKVEAPVIVRLEMNASDGGHTAINNFMLEPGNINLQFQFIENKWQSFAGSTFLFASGTPLNDALFGAIREFDKADKAGNEPLGQQIVLDYILQHKTDLSAALMLERFKCNTRDEAQKALFIINQCSPAVLTFASTPNIIKKINIRLNAPLVGEMFKDFSVEYDGQTHKLSDFVGRGKYVLVDFWGSWCGACISAMPKVIALHEKYKDKDFTALGIAVSDKPAATLAASEKLGIPFPQILNTQFIAANLYGIQSYPSYMLFSPDGNILFRSKDNLQGEEIALDFEALKAKIAEVLGE